MSMFFLIVSMVMALTLGGVGTVTLATGRVAVPRLRNGVGRPGVWGAGVMLLAAGVAAARVVPFEADMALMLGGLVLVGLSQVLGRQGAQQPKE
ncbi:hypothetical protein ACIPJG_31010 [Streptomyces halstedii]|uniref:hypothetical protein n=1 Tax=Streptomyces TaxID=1883 RepID=UPI000805BF21|nr:MULTISPECIES: hypothetical protein [unclassified Streptomyces]MYR70813.1 hypothetical protein [Streptomyces sp. SID4925]SBU94260.1 hypothetical protein YUMDRAFT_05013 [Streptomyces sp. OspMP-M45]